MTGFEELNLLPPIQRALAANGYQVPTSVQAETIPAALSGRDILGCAQTGTGKTAAFALPILHHLGKRDRKAVPHTPRALVLAPTRELAVQIGESFASYGRYLKLRHAVVYGGVGQGRQVQALSRGVHVLVATPGRLLDLMGQGHLTLGRLNLFTLDEADRMLDMGFLPDLKRIMAALPEERQSLFFSATLPPRILQLAGDLLHNPVEVDVTPTEGTVDLIDQKVLYVPREQKAEVLWKVLSGPEVGLTLVFTRTKRGAEVVAKQIAQGGIPAGAIHGNKSQQARQRALNDFRREKLRVLVATDVAARGIDVDGITHVINYEIPNEAESYVHRIGRTGRAGATGIAMSFCDSAEVSDLRAIERLIGQRVPVDPEHPQKALPNKGNGKCARRGPTGKRKYSFKSGPGKSKKSRRSQRSKQPG